MSASWSVPQTTRQINVSAFEASKLILLRAANAPCFAVYLRVPGEVIALEGHHEYAGVRVHVLFLTFGQNGTLADSGAAYLVGVRISPAASSSFYALASKAT